LVAIGEIDGEATVVLTRRALTLDRDPGLIAFPGGYIEPAEDALDAALREAEEEIGLSRRDVEVIGSLGLAERQRSGFRIASYVGLLHGRPKFTISPDEVGDIFEVPLHRLLGDGACWKEKWSDSEPSRSVCFFADPEFLGRNLVWGLTAKILFDLLVNIVVGPDAGEGVA
jgi:8-oxo-dGTP pyrophosphatase MutT (NUDIX family)